MGTRGFEIALEAFPELRARQEATAAKKAAEARAKEVADAAPQGNSLDALKEENESLKRRIDALAKKLGVSLTAPDAKAKTAQSPTFERWAELQKQERELKMQRDIQRMERKAAKRARKAGR